jgi:hypothetical protein
MSEPRTRRTQKRKKNTSRKRLTNTWEWIEEEVWEDSFIAYMEGRKNAEECAYSCDQNLPRRTWLNHYIKWKEGNEWRDKRFQEIQIKEGFLTAQEELKLDSILISKAEAGDSINRSVVLAIAKSTFPQKW